MRTRAIDDRRERRGVDRPGVRAPVRAVLRQDRGSTMVVAMGAMLVMSLLAALTIRASVAGSDATTADARAKLALQAAESGLQTATHRLNMLQPSPERCIGRTVAPAISGSCAAPAESIGNGSSFVYETTPALGGTARCAGLFIRVQTALTQRCITATGTTDGVVRRVQARVAAYASTPLFPAAGLLGLEHVTLNGNVTVPDSTAATNGTLTANGNVRTGGTVLGPTGRTSTSGNVTITPVVKRTTADGPFVLGDVDPGASATTNDNGRIVNGLRHPPVAPFDAVSSGSSLTYDPATRALRAAGNATITLGGGVYNFCSVTIAGNLTLQVAAGAKAAIYVADPDDPDSGCPTGSGNFTVSGNFAAGTTGSDPTALQLYVQGSARRRTTVSFSGNASFRAAVYAPWSDVTISGNAKLIGGLAARSVTMNGNGFQWDGRAGTLQVGSAGLYRRTAWRECGVGAC